MLTPTAPSRRMSSTSRALIIASALTAGLASTAPAAANEFVFHAETAAAFWLDTPQSDRFTPGLYLALRPGLQLNRYIALQLSYALLWTPAASGFTENGTAHMLLGGLRLRPLAGLRPASEQLGGLFVDFNLGYARTETLDRFAFDAGIGYGFQLAPTFSLGVALRYGQIVQPDHIAGRDPNDAQFLTVGLDFGFGPAHREPVATQPQECPAAPPVPPAVVCPPPVVSGCPDYDHDGVCDPVDRCPTQVGTVETWGCPLDPCKGPPIVVLVQFQYDSSQMPAIRSDDPQTMDPVLDSVARAIAQDPSCRVCIVGYASEEGPADYNEALSVRRAVAVQSYMTHRGLTAPRIPTSGFGARCQLVPASSLELNRRVEFRRLQEGEVCPVKCDE